MTSHSQEFLNSRSSRISRYAKASSELSLLDHDRLAQVIAEGRFLGSGIGGSVLAIEISGIPVFVKKIPLTDLERESKNILSTENLYELPLPLLYGIGDIGSTGFNAWRGLCSHILATGWVLADESSHFPLLYHWRMLPELTPPKLCEEHLDIPRAVSYWDGSEAFRKRLEAGRNCSASLVLFQEFFPHTLRPWLDYRLSNHSSAERESLDFIERDLHTITDFLKTRGFVHMDAHFSNFVTDGQQLYLTDFDLALSSRFQLTGAETAFLEQHCDYDRFYALTSLVHRVASHINGAENVNQTLREFTLGRVQSQKVGPYAMGVLGKYAKGAILMKEFIRKFGAESRSTVFPRAELEVAFG